MSDRPAPPVPSIRPGVAVRLWSGSGTMTVEKVDTRVEHPYAQCVWMGPQNKLHKAFLRLDALEVLPPKAPAADTS